MLINTEDLKQDVAFSSLMLRISIEPFQLGRLNLIHPSKPSSRPSMQTTLSGTR